ncbi:MAG: hypothetical protein ACU0BC_00790 [Pseudooceanicola nanhaiensis]
MRFSVQQIKYDFLYAIKEFDSDGSQWGVTVSDLPPAETLVRDGCDPEEHVFLGKPAGTPRAAALVQDFFASRFGVRPVSREDAVPGEWVILFRNRASLPQAADLLRAES